MSYRQDPYARPNQTYNSIRDQAQRETQPVILDRNSLQLHRPSNTYVPTNRNIDSSPQSKWQPEFSQKRNSYQVEISKKAEIKNRIKEIIDLCKDENSAVHKEMGGVIEAERGVYNLLNQADQENFRPNAPGNQFTPIKPDDYRSSNLQKDIKSMIMQNSHIQLPEEAHQLINQIERRALAEIEKLRNELSFEKKKNSELEKELAYYRNNQGAPSGSENELRSKVAYLQDLLQQQEQQKYQGSGGIDFNALYAQGEAIRQQTLRLIRLKEAKLGGGYEDEEKRQLREQVERLQRRLDQVQLERGARVSKPSYEVINEEYSPIAPAYKRSNSNRNSANEYQSLVMEMRKITAN